MSVQHQGVGAGGGVSPPAQSAKLKIICGLKMRKQSFFINKRRSKEEPFG